MKAKIAVLSDIHGNHIALERCIEYAKKQSVDTFLFLGDYIGELAYPEKTMALIESLIQRYPCYLIRGNKEDYMINYRRQGESGWEDHTSTTGALHYTYHLLKSKDIDIFETLPISQRIAIDGTSPFIVCHGSPENNRQKMLPNDHATINLLKTIDTDLVLCGHTHVQNKFKLMDKVILNPGSVGVPLDSQGKTQFMIMESDGDRWNHKFVSLEYDVETTINELKASGLYEHAPYWTRVTEYVLRYGEKSHGRVLGRAMELCRIHTGECMWPEIPECYWAQAFEELTKEM